MDKCAEKFQLVTISDGKIVIEKDYFKRAFVEKNGNSSNVSGLNIRLKAVLLLHLSSEEPRYLPNLNDLEKILGATKSSISKCLCSLEDNKFIFRVIGIGQNIIRASDEEQAKSNER
ncbi:hypothetical protein G9F73_003415 [Clostridium estertheticum]|uniref:hypothetical protein n=1 Tax=Clostridium estertheticum TaxID=238834 RepID=UPI0013EED30A|nr:hypothetical protein [Clostridium estertheticum]MBZ9606879.1 hypothetical protein [Clostridium estertheticum]